MKAEIIKNRPDHELLKQSDVVAFYHMQFPRWLMENSRYCMISLEAKFTYMLLFNRFQLSKHNDWINEEGEVFVIYTRQELAGKLNVSEKSATSAIRELKDIGLIWEQRCGRGFANQIYLVNVQTSLEDSLQSKGGPLDKLPVEILEADHDDLETDYDDLRTEEMTGLLNESEYIPSSLDVEDSGIEANKKDASFENEDNLVDNSVKNVDNLSRNSTTAVQDPSKQPFKTRQNCGSRTAETAVQDPSEVPSSNKDFNKKDISYYNQSQSESSQYSAPTHDRQTDNDELEQIIANAELDYFDKSDADVIRDAIERLYYTQSIKANNAVYPIDRIRHHLKRLNYCIVEDAISKIRQNVTNKIRNSSAYVTVVLFNTIMESNSDLIVDPYLNFLRSSSQRAARNALTGDDST